MKKWKLEIVLDSEEELMKYVKLITKGFSSPEYKNYFSESFCAVAKGDAIVFSSFSKQDLKNIVHLI